MNWVIEGTVFEWVTESSESLIHSETSDGRTMTDSAVALFGGIFIGGTKTD